MESSELQLKFFHRSPPGHFPSQRRTANGIVPREEVTTPIALTDTTRKEHAKPPCRSLCLPRRRQGKLTARTTGCAREKAARLRGHGVLTIGSYGLFKATDKKMLKNEELAAELGRPEKVVEM